MLNEKVTVNIETKLTTMIKNFPAKKSCFA